MLWKRSINGLTAYPSMGFLLAVVLIAAGYWIAPLLVNPHRSANETILFRQAAGDPDYLPQVSATARLNIGETSVIEQAGKGVRSFPVAPILPHALFFRFLGDAGFLLADILLTLSYAFALRYFLHQTGVLSGIAELLSVVVVSGTAGWMIEKVWRFGLHLPILFWEVRFPRPFVTEVFVVLCFIFAYTVLRDADQPRRSTWFLLGLSLACLVQSDIYEATNLLLVFAAITAYLLITGKSRRAVLLGSVITSITTVVGSLFFVYQYLHASRDVMRRWGAFPTHHQPIFIGGAKLLLTTVVVFAVGIFLAYRASGDHKRRTALILAGVAVVASFLSGPLSTVILSQTLQIYHYRDAAYLMIGYACLLYAGHLLTAAVRSRLLLAGGRARRFRWTASSAGAFVVVLGLALTYRNTYEHAKSDYPTAPSMLLYADDLALKHYRSGFSQLRQRLAHPPYSGALVLGTTDVQLADWWQYQGKYLYLPDIFNSLSSDREMETRAYSFAHLLGSSTEEFGQLLDSGYFPGRWITGGKYIANSLFTPWPIGDYSEDAQRRIAQTSPLQSWHLELPLSERRRLIDEYSQFSTNPTKACRLDLVVLNGGRWRKLFHPERGALKLGWSNDTFEVWVPARTDALTKDVRAFKSEVNF